MSGRGPSLIVRLALPGLLLLSACASQAQQSGAVGDAVGQPLRDLNVGQPETARILRDALLAPYAMPRPETCEALSAEIGRLDLALGPDVDQLAPDSNDGDALVSGAIRSLTGLPFSGVIRQISGAAARDREQRRQILAGVARRAFLKGVLKGRNCPP